MITVKPINIDQVRWAIQAAKDKRGLEFVATCFNAGADRGEMDHVFTLPTTYTRYATLIADLERIEQQMLNVLAGRDALTGEPLLNEVDTREWSVESIERDHEEALEMNGLFNSAAFRFFSFWIDLNDADRAEAVEKAHGEALAMDKEYQAAIATIADNLSLPVWERCSSTVKREVIEHLHAEALEQNAEYDSLRSGTGLDAFEIYWLNVGGDYEGAKEDFNDMHTEALEINAAIESMIAGRQTIADNKPDFSQETWEIVRLGNAYKEAGREWYRWAKDAAIRLWENRACAATH